MELRGKRILVISPEGWRGLNMSKHHVSQGLMARGNKVCFWGPTPPGTKQLTIERIGELDLAFTPHWFPGVNRLPLTFNRWYYARQIAAIEKKLGAPFDIIWCFDTSRLQAFPNTRHYKLLHLVDYDILYHGHDLMRSADLIVTTADVINTKVRTIAPHTRMFKVGHALDPRWLEGADHLEEPHAAAPVRNVVYSGQFFNTYIDWKALLTIAEQHPTITFSYVGNLDPDFPSDAFQKLRTLPNVVFTGLKTKDELVPIVRNADILTFCFMTDKKMLERANPHKVLEYLSTGNVIVGSWTLEYEPHQDLLFMARERGDFVPLFNKAVAEFNALNSREHRAARIAFTETRTVPALLDHIERLIRGEEEVPTARHAVNAH